MKKASDIVRNQADELMDLEEMQRCVGILEDLVKEFDFEARSASRNTGHVSDDSKASLDTVQGLVSLHGRLLRAQTQAGACDKRWQQHLQRAALMERMLQTTQRIPLMTDNSSDAGERDEDSPPFNPKMSIRNVFRGSFLSNVKDLLADSSTGVSVLVWTYRTLAIICAIFSALLIWSQLTMAATHMNSPFGLMLAASSEKSSNPSVTSRHIFEVQTVSFLSLAYMSLCTYWSLFRLNLGWAYSLQGPHQTSSASLMFNGAYFARLQFSLGYNFILLLHLKSAGNTAFMTLMQDAETIPLFGASMGVYVPILMSVVALLTVCSYTVLFSILMQ